MTSFCAEIMGQPEALRRLVEHYRRSPGLLSSIPAPQELLLTGMGASLHAAQVGAYHLQSLGRRALAFEAGDLAHYGAALLDGQAELLYISQSGRSAEVVPLLSATPNRQIFAAITNDLDSPLSRSARYPLPLAVESETLVATQTYTNSLAILWMLARHWAGQDVDNTQILRLADGLQALLDRSDAVAGRWLEVFREVETVIFTGYGMHSATARQSAQTVAEWVKVPVLGLSAGALRHGFIEIVSEKTGVVIYSGVGAREAPADRLADELAGYGARLLVVRGGTTTRPGDDLEMGAAVDPFLAPVLDAVPAQLYAEALAAELGVPPGFRYLSKVVRKV